jgi:hypothetical protein
MRNWVLAVGLGLLGGAACVGGTEPLDTDAPFVAITPPMADPTISGQVNYTAQVLDGFGVARVRFLVDGNEIGEDISAPFGVIWSTLGAGDGPHALRVEAVDFAGNTGFASISVMVDNARQ